MKLKNKMLFLLGIPVVLLVAILIIVFSIFSSKIVTNSGYENIYNCLLYTSDAADEL